MRNNDKFAIESFLEPDASFSPVYIWVWNDICTREIIDEQLSEMRRLGIRSFYILPEPAEFRPHSMPTSLSPEYLSEEYFELCAYAIEKGTSTVSIGAYAAVLAVLELDDDLELIALDEEGKKQFREANLKRRERASKQK